MLTPLYPVTNQPATITVVAPGALAGDTEVPIAPLTIELATGAVLDFGDVKFARLADDAAVDDETLTTDPLPSDLEAGDTYDVPGSKASSLLHDTFVGASADKQVAMELAVEGILGLTAGYTGDDADWLAFAKVLQINFMIERGDESLVKKSIARGNPSASETYRDRSINPDAALIVGRITKRQQVRFTPPFVGV